MLTHRGTVLRSGELQGTGLHTAEPCTVRLTPSSSPGISFTRTDQPNGPSVLADVHNVAATNRRVVLAKDNVTVSTVEHLMAAAWVAGITDLSVLIDGPELPIFDGSAVVFWDTLRSLGRKSGAELPPIRIVESDTWRIGDSVYAIRPAPTLIVAVTVEWDHPAIGRQECRFNISPETFEAELAPARTFGFLKDAEEFMSMGLAKGAGLDNAIILDDHGAVAGISLRWPDEFVRHKTLDLLGDLALIGYPVLGEISAFRPSHQGNVELVKRLLRNGHRGA